MAITKIDITMLEDVSGANNLVKLDANAKIPAGTGANLLNKPGPLTSASDPTVSSNKAAGTEWLNTTSGEMYVCTNATTDSNIWTNVGDGSGDIQKFQGEGSNYGYACAPWTTDWPSGIDTISKYSYASDTDAVDAGQNLNFTAGGEPGGGVSSATHGYVMIQHATHSNTGTMRKFQFNTSNDMTTVGNLSTGTTNRVQTNGTHSSTHGYCCGGGEPTELDVIDKWPFASDTNATDVGNLTQSRRSGAATCSFTHGYMAGGGSFPPNHNIIDKWAFATDADATDVGNLLTADRNNNDGAQSRTYGYCCAGGDGGSNTIYKWSYATDADATDVGDLLDTCRWPSTSSSTTHGYRAGGYGSANRIDKWSFTTDGNATDVADLLGTAAGHVGNQY